MLRKKQFVCYEMTVSPDNSFLYLKKAFFEQFVHEIEICMSEEYPGELIVKELDEGKIRQRYYSKSLVSEIVKISKNKKTMTYAFFKDTETQVWRGFLLPKLNDSILWHDLYVVHAEGAVFRDFSATPILYKMWQKYFLLMEWDELQNYYLLWFDVVKEYKYFI